MVEVRGDVQIHAIGWFVWLDEAVSVHFVLCWIDIGEEIWCGSFAGVMEGVCADVFVR